jgi:hypothetical protein
MNSLVNGLNSKDSEINFAIETGVNMVKNLYEMDSNTKEKYSNQLLTKLDISKRLYDLTKVFTESHKDLCEKYAFRKGLGEQSK